MVKGWNARSCPLFLGEIKMFSSQQPEQVVLVFMVSGYKENPELRTEAFMVPKTLHFLNLAEAISLTPARGSEEKFCPLALCHHPQINGWGFKGKDTVWNSDVVIPSPPRPSRALSLAHSLSKSFPGWHFQSKRVKIIRKKYCVKGSSDGRGENAGRVMGRKDLGYWFENGKSIWPSFVLNRNLNLYQWIYPNQTVTSPGNAHHLSSYIWLKKYAILVFDKVA